MSSTASRLETGADSEPTPYWEEIGPGMRVLRGEIDITEAIGAMKKFHKNSSMTRKQREAAKSLRKGRRLALKESCPPNR